MYSFCALSLSLSIDSINKIFMLEKILLVHSAYFCAKIIYNLRINVREIRTKSNVIKFLQNGFQATKIKRNNLKSIIF